MIWVIHVPELSGFVFRRAEQQRPQSHASPLETLYQVYRALRARREQHNLVMEDRHEFRWVLNESRQIESIEPSEKLLSQKLVEELREEGI